MVSQQENNRSYSKLAQIYSSFQTDYLRGPIVQKLVRKEGDINFKIPSNSPINKKKPELAGCTALHIAAIEENAKVVNILLSNGADFTIQNKKGNTILHYVCCRPEPIKEMIDTILSSHLSLADPSNPCNFDGVSHFHIACMYNRQDVVEFFLNSGIPVNAVFTTDAKKYDGYTPLHFAAERMALTVIRLLLKHNAIMNIRDARGMTPLHVLLHEKIKISDIYNFYKNDNLPHMSFEVIDDVINLLLDSNEVDHIGLTHFHIACAQRDTSVAEYFLEQEVNINQQVNMDSPIYPGYTALHFAAHCNPDIVIMLLKKKADFSIKDANGDSAMDIFWKKCKHEDLQRILSHNWKYATFSDKETRVLDFVKAWVDPWQIKTYLNSVKDITSRIAEIPACWAGRTLLHFAVMLYKKHETEMIKVCMEEGLHLLLDRQDFYGSTPIHLAFRMGAFDVVLMLMENRFGSNGKNLADNDGLSYLHIASALSQIDHVPSFCYENVDVAYQGKEFNSLIKTGSTALHVAVSRGNEKIVKTLLDCGLDLGVKDANGETPIHRFFKLSEKTESIGRVLLSAIALTDERLAIMGVTRLHMAVYCKIIDIDLYITADNINVKVNCEDSSSFWHRYNGCTALHIAMKKRLKIEIIKLLVHNGADLCAKDPQGDTPFYTALTYRSDSPVMNYMMEIIRRNKSLRRQLEELSGITIFHLACYTLNFDAVDWMLMGVAQHNVHARVKSDCVVWPGCTPLHLLLRNIEHHGVTNTLIRIFKLLIAEGADVTAADSNGMTPILIALEYLSKEHIFTVLRILLQNLQVYDVNPVNKNGMSYFHAACLMKHAEMVKSFLTIGVDINQPIDFFADHFAGETPLHLSVEPKTQGYFGPTSNGETVLDLMLSNGADIKAEDSYGNTAMHKVAKLKDNLNILEKFVGYGASIDARNILEQTPLEFLLKSEHVSVEAIKFFEQYGCRLNVSNPLTEEGYISMLVSHIYHTNYKNISSLPLILKVPAFQAFVQSFEAMVDAVDSCILDDMGRNLIHNLVTTSSPYTENFSYDELMKRFQSAGVSINLQDKKGKTALHLAAHFGNAIAVESLLNNGADINVVDEENNTPFSYSLEYYDHVQLCIGGCHEKVTKLFTSHVCKLQELKLELRQDNITYKDRAFKKFSYDTNNFCGYYMFQEIKKAKYFLIDNQPELLVKDFLDETGKGLTTYPFMSDTRRDKVDQFFRNYDDALKDVCTLQYQKAVKRVHLVKSAMKNVWTVTGVTVPIVCIEMIFQYLTNSDLENFIKGTTNVENECMMVD